MIARRTISKPTAVADCPGRAGFTLLEVILVMSILVVMFAMVMPNLSGLSDWARLGRTTDDLIGLLRGLRVRAMTEGCMYRFTAQPGGSQYQVERLPAVDNSQTGTAATSERVRYDGAVVGVYSLESPLQFRQLTQSSLVLIDNSNPSATSSTLDASAGATSTTSAAGGPNAATQGIMVTFFADGAANSVGFAVVDDGRVTEITVRGVTGVVSVTQK